MHEGQKPGSVSLAESRITLLEAVYTSTRSRLIPEAFRKVDRARFIPEDQQADAYKNVAIQAGDGFSISQPTLIALMVDYLGLTGKERVLEVGTGSGYTTAILSLCASEVVTIDYNSDLVDNAKKRLSELGYGNNTKTYVGDGLKGVNEEAPFDAIIVTAGAKSIPESLTEQLAIDGRLVIPVGEDPLIQDLIFGIRLHNALLAGKMFAVSFHPLISCEEGGWTPMSMERVWAFKKHILLEPKKSLGLPLEQAIRAIATEQGIPFAEFDFPEFVKATRIPDTQWEGFENFIPNIKTTEDLSALQNYRLKTESNLL